MTTTQRRLTAHRAALAALVLATAACKTPSVPAVGPAATADPSASAVPADLPTSAVALAATAAAAALLPGGWAAFGETGTDPGQMVLPFDVAADGHGLLYVTDTTGLSQYDTAGNFKRRIGEGQIKRAESVAVDAAGDVYVSGNGSQVEVYGPDGELRRKIGVIGSDPGQLVKPTDLALDAQGHLFVVDSGNQRVEKFTAGGQHLQTIGGPGEQNGEFVSPRALAVDSAGRIYVGTAGDFLIQRFTPEGEYLDTFGAGTMDETLFRIGGIAVDGRGTIYVSQVTRHLVQAFDAEAQPRPDLMWEMGGMPGLNEREFNGPGGMTIDGDRLYVADTKNNRIVAMDLSPRP